MKLIHIHEEQHLNSIRIAENLNFAFIIEFYLSPIYITGVVFAIMIGIIALFPNTYASSTSFPSLDLTLPSVLDPRGEELEQVTKGQQVAILESVTNSVFSEDTPLVMIFEIRDEEGVTIYLAWQSTELSPDETYALSTSWIVPELASSGETYSIRALALSSISETPQPLSAVMNKEIEIA